jgi:glycosyl transferase family 25
MCHKSTFKNLMAIWSSKFHRVGFEMQSLPLGLDCAFVINLPERKDRFTRVKVELNGLGTSIGDGSVRLLPAYRFAERKGFPNAGVRGCFLSHLECLRRAHAEARRNVVIFEDDVVFGSALKRLTPTIVDQLATLDWDIVFFGHFGTGNIPNVRPDVIANDIEFVLWSHEIQGMHFYAVNGRIFPELISDIDRHLHGIEGDQEYGPMPIDGAYNIFRRNNPHIRTFIARPKLGWQASSLSDITPRGFDSVSALRPILRIGRWIKAAFNRWRA